MLYTLYSGQKVGEECWWVQYTLEKFSNVGLTTVDVAKGVRRLTESQNYVGRDA